MRDDDLPLTESDFASIRASVLTRIHRPPRAPRVAFALAAVAIAIVGVISPLNRPSPMPKVPPPLPRATLTLPVPSVQEIEQTREAPIVATRTSASRRSGKLSVTYMHIQTADPDVRIIWIARQEGP
jgi:hypothetical protein